jgi:NADH-quinone oxidoreductase subunit J
MAVDWIVFLAGTLIALSGAIGVVTLPNPVHAALSLVLTLFGVAVLFVAQAAHFLAVVQVIVYAGAVVVLFLFVIMLLGVDRTESEFASEPLRGQRPAAAVIGVAALGLLLALSQVDLTIGAKAVAGTADGPGTNVEKIADSVFTRYVFAFEITSVLLVIAVVGAVLLARKPRVQVDEATA